MLQDPLDPQDLQVKAGTMGRQVPRAPRASAALQAPPDPPEAPARRGRWDPRDREDRPGSEVAPDPQEPAAQQDDQVNKLQIQKCVIFRPRAVKQNGLSKLCCSRRCHC